MKSLIPLALIPLAFAAVVTVGCDDTSTGGDGVAALQKRLDDMESKNAELQKRLVKAERDLASANMSISRFGDKLERSAAAMSAVDAAEAAPETGDAPVAAMSSGAAAPNAISDYLQSDDGQKALDEAMTKIEARRDAARREQMAGFMIDRFAEMANLTAEQSERLKKATATGFDEIRGLFATLRDQSGTPEERQAARVEAMAKMGEVREKVNAEARQILDNEQYQMFEEQQSRMMRGFGGGDMGGFGGRGGAGGGRFGGGGRGN